MGLEDRFLDFEKAKERWRLELLAEPAGHA